MTTINTKTLQALTKLTNKKNMCFYAHGIYLDKGIGRAIVSDSLTLVSVPLEVTEENSVIVKGGSCDTQAKVAKAQKAETVDLEISQETTIQGKYPSFEKAFPEEGGLTVSVSLENLKKVVDALAAIPTADKRKLVTLKFDGKNPTNRPVLLETEEGAQALIVPTRSV